MRPMADTPTVATGIEDLEAMTAGQRAEVFREAMVTDLDLLDDHEAAVVARGRDRALERLRSIQE